MVYSSSDSTPEIGENGVSQGVIGSGVGSFSDIILSLTPSTPPPTIFRPMVLTVQGLGMEV